MYNLNKREILECIYMALLRSRVYQWILGVPEERRAYGTKLRTFIYHSEGILEAGEGLLAAKWTSQTYWKSTCSPLEDIVHLAALPVIFKYSSSDLLCLASSILSTSL